MRVRRVAQAKMDALLETADLVATPMGHLGAPPLAEVTGLDPTSVMTSLHTAYWNPRATRCSCSRWGFPSKAGRSRCRWRCGGGEKGWSCGRRRRAA
ncbi:hypothetical protein [Amycolatopsis echigonensis]|uniref:hypothetical protein n=1 Tax=Amycolatopsis echigonensis TaxID=2576905 RepID=UPI001FE4D729|nr:hypothetical protein [Amycolatopsis echigonensis]